MTVPCLLWTGAKTSSGYGYRWVNGHQVMVHRIALAKKLGRPIALGKFACHTCDVPLCIEPEHLWEGTNAENIQDAGAKGKMARRGEGNGRSILTAKQVAEIRANCRPNRPGVRGGADTIRATARRYGVNPATIGDVLYGRRWAVAP